MMKIMMMENNVQRPSLHDKKNITYFSKYKKVVHFLLHLYDELLTVTMKIDELIRLKK